METFYCALVLGAFMVADWYLSKNLPNQNYLNFKLIGGIMLLILSAFGFAYV